MTDEPIGDRRSEARIIHLPKRRMPKSAREQASQDLEIAIAGHFREQNELLRTMNTNLSDKVQRLTNGIERLVDEMHGVRTGRKEEAFARVGSSEAPPDLPTVSAEAALIYTLTAAEIGEVLDFRASQIGLLLSTRGLGWAGNSDFQELTRHKRATQQKFWHRDLPDRLRKVLDDGMPENRGISDKGVLAIFRRWHERKAERALLDRLEPTESPH
jgi:hypothetical protein